MTYVFEGAGYTSWHRSSVDYNLTGIQRVSGDSKGGKFMRSIKID